MLIPLICLIIYSFTNYDLVSTPKWIGFENYIKMFTIDDEFWISLWVTTKYAVISVPLKLIISLAIAMLLNRPHKGLSIYRTLFYIPSIIGGSVAVAVMWKNLFARDGGFNDVLGVIFGVKPDISWVADPRTALGSIILLVLWQFGSTMIIFLAGLKNISDEYYEAAIMDGANKIQQFFRITLPMLSPVILFNLVMQIIGGFMVFTQGLIITNGGPDDKTLFYQLLVYNEGFVKLHMGYASALSVVLLIIISVLTAIVMRTSKHWVFYASEGR
jgi:multiple sugar transport system permease protein